MSEDWKKAPDAYPKTRAQCFDQGRRDFLAGYKMTWTPNLGPMTRDEKAMASWREGWLLQRDEVIETWCEEAGRVQGSAEDSQGDSAGSRAEGTAGGSSCDEGDEGGS